jgi:hypothetical protein
VRPAEPEEALAILDALPGAGVSPGEVFRELQERGLGDGLPVGEASTTVIEAMLDAAGILADDMVVAVPPLRGMLTGWRLATCAALAGCEPAHVPLLAVAVSTLVAPELNAYGYLTTTGSAATLLLVNGPARNALHFNSGTNCLGPGNRANATVGRAMSLILRIVGGAREGMADMATMGQPAKYTCCFAEREEASPWAPLAEERGVAPGRSAVTVLGISGTIEVFDATTTNAGDMLDVLASAIAHATPTPDEHATHLGGGQPLVVLTPEWADFFHRSGLAKSDIGLELHERGWRDVDGRRLHIATVAEDILIVIAGGTGIKQTIIPNWNGISRAVTKEVPPAP